MAFKAEYMYFDISLIKIYLDIKKLWKFENMQMDCNGSGHIVGCRLCDFTKDKPEDILH